MRVIVHYRRYFSNHEREFASESRAWIFIKNGEDAGDFFAGHIIAADTRKVLWDGATGAPFRRPRWQRPAEETVLPPLKIPA